jgi:hypothetical protein
MTSIEDFLHATGGSLHAEFVEIQSGKDDGWPKL